MLTIVLIRPGSTDYDSQKRIQGNLDIPLNKEGEEEIAGLVTPLAGMQIDAVYYADNRSAKETAEFLAAALDRKSVQLDRLSNIDLGLWQGMLIDDVKVKQPKVYRQWQEHPETVCPPEGETLSEAHHRVSAAISKIQKKYKDGTVALVAPEPLASLIRSELRSCEVGDLWKNNCNKATWEAIEIQPPITVKAS